MTRLLLGAAIAAALLVAGCSKSPELDTSLGRPRLDQPDSAAMKRCALPLKIKGVVLTQEEAEALWGKDVDHLIECARRHDILIDFILTRDGGLTGTAGT